MLPLRIAFVLLTLGALAGWTYPVSGVNYPSTGQGHDYVANNACVPGGELDCYGISETEPGSLMFIYKNGGPQWNAHFIAGYALELQEDCFNRSLPRYTWTAACLYLDYQYDYLLDNHLSPKTDMDTWPMWGYPDGMIQAELAVLFDREANYTNVSSWKTLSSRAGKAFDYSPLNGGVAKVYDSNHYWYLHTEKGGQTYTLNAMNIAVRRLMEMCNSRGIGWCTRVDRGLWTLGQSSTSRVSVHDFDCFNCTARRENNTFTTDRYAWSYYSTEPLEKAKCGYQMTNVDTLRTLADAVENREGFSGTAGLFRTYAARWEGGFNAAVAAGDCDP